MDPPTHQQADQRRSVYLFAQVNDQTLDSNGTWIVYDDDGITPLYSQTFTDKDGNPRPSGAEYDIGAYEVDGAPTPTPQEIDVYPGDNIQENINAANNGDVIILHEGTYYETINFSGKSITIRSTNPENPAVVASTIIDGEQAGSVVTFNNGEGSDSLLCGIKVQKGDGDFGGGIYCNSSSPTIAKCIITENSSNWGAGICCEYSSSPLIANCTINENSSGNGGGVYYFNSSLSRLIDCTIINNSGSY